MFRDSTVHRFAAVLGLVALACAAGPAARALPVPEVDRTRPSATPSPPPAGIGVLPAGSPLYFVLDDGLSSARSRAGDIVHLHLRDALIVNGTTVAPAGSPATLTVVRTHHAASGDNDGSIQITLQPLTLPVGTLPIRAVNEYLTIDHTAGQLSTRDASDTVVDIFVPTYILWQALRKGHEYVLQPGTVLRVLSAAAVDARDPRAIAIVSPPPLLSGGDAPHSAITAAPFFTPAPLQTGRPKKGKPTPSPSPSPTASPAPADTSSPASSAASAAPAPTGSG